MAKTKKVTFNMINATINEADITEIMVNSENDISLTVKRFLDFDDSVRFVRDIADSCFDQFDNYIPECFDFAVFISIMVYYAGVQLPTDFAKAYRVYTQGNIMDSVLDCISPNQLHQLIGAARDRVDYKKTVLAQANIGKVAELINSVENMVNDSKMAMEEVRSPEFKATLGDMLRALGGERANGKPVEDVVDKGNVALFRRGDGK